MSECIEWEGYRDGNGYGRFRLEDWLCEQHFAVSGGGGAFQCPIGPSPPPDPGPVKRP